METNRPPNSGIHNSARVLYSPLTGFGHSLSFCSSSYTGPTGKTHYSAALVIVGTDNASDETGVEENGRSSSLPHKMLGSTFNLFSGSNIAAHGKEQKFCVLRVPDPDIRVSATPQLFPPNTSGPRLVVQSTTGMSTSGHKQIYCGLTLIDQKESVRNTCTTVNGHSAFEQNRRNCQSSHASYQAHIRDASKQNDPPTIRPATGSAINTFPDTIRFFAEKVVTSPGLAQTWCGLKLINGDIRKQKLFPQPARPTHSLTTIKNLEVVSQEVVCKNGTLQRYCGFKLTGINPFTHVSQNVPGEPAEPARAIQAPLKAPSTSTGGKQRTSRKQPGSGSNVRTPKRAAFMSTGAAVTYFSIGSPSYTCANCNARMWYGERTKGAGTQATESFSLCCQDGKILLPTRAQTPEPLKTLLDYQNTEASRFKEHIRVYNSMFAFTSFGAKIDNSVNAGKGMYTFRISGQSYHRIGSLLPVAGEQPKYAQLYFFDTQNELRNRLTAFMGIRESDTKIDIEIVSDLIRMLNEHSMVAKAFRMARDWCNDHNDADCELHLLGQRTISRQYDTPNVSEVAVLVTGDFGQSTEPRDVIVSKNNGQLKRISELHQLYMALQYPLLFPYGDTGFHEKIPYHRNTGKRKTKRECLTMREYYSYQIHDRDNGASTLLRGGRLFQQYLVDAYAAIEEQRLRWMRTHQSELRVDLYNNVHDAVTRGDTRAEAIGQRIVLPSTFTGSPRYMIQNYQDAMALCRAFKNPDLFITFTANPRWPEIDAFVAAVVGQKPNDRPETVARVFKLKLAEMMDDIMTKQIFGECIAVVYTIEFQKRGLPHAHMLLWLENKYKCRTPADIDDLISAEIPSPARDPAGYKAVTDYMLHGPCGQDARKAPCTVDGKCTKRFPKPYYAETTIDEDGYPVYRRRNNHVSVLKGKTRLDNRFVVPYNRYLLLKYEAHINIELCNRSRAIKYLFKYLNKGPDRATMIVHENVSGDGQTRAEKIVKVDEIKNYLDCRYLSPCEAVWRIFGFDIHFSSPSVMKLSFHLPDQHTITLHDSQSLPALLRRDGIKETMFTRWFELNRNDPHARQFTYAEIPKSYVWIEQNKVWQRRSKQKSIGRIVYCSPAAGPKYYLRMLLNVVKGPTCYEEIKTVEGKTFTTFKQACFAYGLINDDDEWTEAIAEATLWATGSQLRELFVTILLFCDVNSPLQLWEANWQALAEDVLYRKRKLFMFPGLQLSENQIKNYCLVDLQQLLHRNGKSLDDFPDLPKPEKQLLTDLDNRLIREELAYNFRDQAIEHQKLFSNLNSDQHFIYEAVIKSVEEQTGGFYFVYGPGGTGKTFLYKTIITKLRSQGMIVLAVASSGIASLLLPGGRTAHSRFLIPLELLESSTCAIKQNTNLAALLQQARLIIWDEAPMTQKYAFEALDKTLRDILGYEKPKNRDKLFGGLTVLLGGDFRQILPVIPKGRRQEVVHSCINRSDLWKACRVFTLTQSMRVKECASDGSVDTHKQSFNKWVLDVGDGTVHAKARPGEEEPTWIKIPDEFVITYTTSPIEQIVKETFPDFENRQYDDEYLRERAILTPKNTDADEINEHMFNKLNRPAKEYKSSDEVCKASTDTLDQQDLYPIEFLNSLNFPGMPPHVLNVKEGLPVMLLRNVSPTQGLCNGTRLIITDLGRFVIRARIITGSNIGETALIPRITLTSTQTKWPFVVKRRQFPIKACYAMTINKSQGQSLNYVGLYLPNPVFSHGQLYVAISRVTKPEGLRMLMLNDGDSDFHNHTKNIVYKETFNNLYQCT